MSRSIDRALVAQGALRERPFAHLLLDAHRREANGTLTLIAEASGEVTIRLQRGRPNKALLATQAADLMRALLPLCALAQGSFRLYEDVDLLTGVTDAMSGHVDPFRLLAASLEAHVREDIVETVLARYSKCALRLPPRRDLGWLRLGQRDGVLIELIRAAPSTPEELIAQAPLPAERTRRLLYGLLVTKMLIPYDQQSQDVKRSQPTIASARSSGASRRSAPAWQALASLRPRVVSRISSLDPAGHSPVVSTTPPSTARPSVPGAQPASGRSSPAWQTLASLRPRVVSAISSLEPGRQSHRGNDTPAPSSSSSSAVTPRPSGTMPVATPASSIAQGDIPARIKRVEELVRGGCHDEALAEVNALLQLEPNRAELHGLQALVLFEKYSKGADGLPRRVLHALKKALWLDPEETYALYTRGLICKRGGDPSRALSCFKRVLELDPDHIDAQREFRLAKLRGAKEAGG